MITEALLEMYFFRALADLFKAAFGAGILRVLKPSPRREAWVGFDQGYASTTLTTKELFDQLKKGIQHQSGAVPGFYFGYFLQFKVVEQLVRGSNYMPTQYLAPYLRVELSLKPNQTTGLSQHETLQRVSGIKNACVNYACPMVFDIADIWKQPDLGDLRFIDLNTSPSGWLPDERHFITFQSSNDQNPLWHSEPVSTRAITLEEWLSRDSKYGPRPMSGAELVKLMKEAEKVIRETMIKKEVMTPRQTNGKLPHLLPSSFTIMEMSFNKE